MASIGQGLVWLFRRVAAAPAPPAWLDGPYTLGVTALLEAYRIFLSRLSGRRCMFRPGCSSFAVQQLREHGWTAGRATILARLDCCNGQYVMAFDGQACSMMTSDGVVHDEAHIADWLLQQYRRDHARLIERLQAGR